jgi:ubiquinone/menaquinone biosynthesis C-methylase UbiE
MTQGADKIDARALHQIADALRPLKLRSYEVMKIDVGAHVLDIGCGPGIDTIPLANLVGSTGKVVGVDVDESMLAQAEVHAREMGLTARVVHQQGDVSALPFRDATFDACRAERLFQVLSPPVDPMHALGEMRRVTRPGGRVVIAGADWGTASLDAPDTALERKLMQFFADRLRPNGYAARQLFRLFRRHRFVGTTVELFPVAFRQSSSFPPAGDWVTREASAAGIVTPEDVTRWHAGLEQAEASGTFFGSMCMVIVAGRVP